MLRTDATYKVAMERPELEYLISKKKQDVARLYKALKFLVAIIIVIAIAIGAGIFAIAKFSPGTFINRNEPPPDILATCLHFILGAFCIIAIGTVYSYFRTLRKPIKDIRSGEKTIEPCMVIRKVYASENNTYHVYITSNVRLSIEVTMNEYALLNEGDKINIAYSSCSKIFFGYFIEKYNAKQAP